MIGLVLVTHGRLAAEFVTAMEHVVGPQEAIEPICIGPEDDMEARRTDIAAADRAVDTGDGRDPADRSVRRHAVQSRDLADEGGRIEVIAGINLPMLIRLASARRKTMKVKAAVAAAREAGRKYISVASEVLGEAAA